MNAISSSSAVSSAPPFPKLRSDLRLHQGPSGERGPTWIIEDPVRNRYFEIDMRSSLILSCWDAGSPQAIQIKAKHEADAEVTSEEVMELCDFLMRNGLSEFEPFADYAGMTARIAKQKRAGSNSRSIIIFSFVYR